MKGRKLFLCLFLLIFVGVGIIGAKDGKKYLSLQKAFYLTEAELIWIRPGLHLDIQSVEVTPPSVTVTFRIADDKGQGLDRLGIMTPGEVSTSFILARIKPGDTQYTAYTARTVTSSITGNSAVQAGTDSGGSYESLGDGVYKYTFGTPLPGDFEADATHTVGIYSRRDLTEFEFDRNAFVANALFDFVPSGGELIQVRDVVATAACNQCHNPLGLHGSIRRETGLCILCHQPQSSDPDTGNTVDFKVMIHKIHRGEDLPSVEAGTPYQIIGYRNSVHDYSTVEFPQDVRNCTTCHQQAAQADNWKNNPSRVACGSCHDNVNFATGEHHPGGVQLDDGMCTVCHTADTGVEFDISVAGAHTIPEFSEQLAGIKVEILDVTNTNPGDNPTVHFSITDKNGDPVDIADLDRVRFNLAGPTSDYTFQVGPETASSATAGPSGYTYTLGAAIPADASGTYAIATEARQTLTLAGPLMGESIEGVRDNAFNDVFYFGVGGSETVPRRQVVDVNNCNQCHKNLSMHGGSRENTEYCVFCHNPATVDNPEGAPGGPFDVPPQSINFRFMIHRVHTGEELTRDFTIYRSRGVYNFNHVEFPGDRRDCAKCHVNDSYELPLPADMAYTEAPREFYSPLGPAASACLGCHDSLYAAAHAFVMTAPFGESCAACHAEGRDFAVSKIHAR